MNGAIPAPVTIATTDDGVGFGGLSTDSLTRSCTVLPTSARLRKLEQVPLNAPVAGRPTSVAMSGRIPDCIILAISGSIGGLAVAVSATTNFTELSLALTQLAPVYGRMRCLGPICRNCASVIFIFPPKDWENSSRISNTLTKWLECISFISAVSDDIAYRASSTSRLSLFKIARFDRNVLLGLTFRSM